MKHLESYKLFENKYFPKELGDFVYHQTCLPNAEEILADGFKTGYELNKGERNSGIFFSATHRGQEGATYARCNGRSDKVVMVEVNIEGLKLLDTRTLKEDPNLPSFKQPDYVMMRKVKTAGEFPDGYDGIAHYGYTGGIYEIALKPEIANERITGRILNTRGKVLNIGEKPTGA